MKFYTKEWYELMQKQSYISGFRKIPDKVYSNKEIKDFYQKALREEIARDRKLYNTPPSYEWTEELLSSENFNPENFLFVDEESKEMFHPQSIEMAKEYIEKERREREEQFQNRPSFDPSETIEYFEECYRMGVRYGAEAYPNWVKETVDKRLLALNLMPEIAYKRLKEEGLRNRRAFQKIERKAKKVLEKQEIPQEIQSMFVFHDANLLSLKKVRSDIELILKKDGYWPKGTTPYIKIIFKNIKKFEREKGFSIRIHTNEDGEFGSNCVYLYDELYRTEDGYEVHMLLWTIKALRYLTIGCETICFEDNIQI